MAADVDSSDPFVHLLSRPVRGCCNDQQLDALILGELGAHEAGVLRAHLGTSKVCSARHDELRGVHERWQQSAPPLPSIAAPSPPSITASAAPVVRRADRRRWSSRAAVAGVLAAAAAVIVVVARPAGIDDEIVRTKGSHLKASFAVVGGADLYDGDTLALPATLQVVVRSDRAGVFVVDVRDADGDDVGARSGDRWRTVFGPAVLATTSTTAQIAVTASTAARVQLRVLACKDAEAVAALTRGDAVDCDVDAITVESVR